MTTRSFTQYLRATLPPDSALLDESPNAGMFPELGSYLERARELRFFDPFKLVTVQRWHPAAGAPGVVVEDVRALWDVQDDSFQPSLLEWINGFRQDHPLDLRAMTQEDAIAYVQEIVHMIPRADRWGFKIESVSRDRRPRNMYINYCEKKRMGTHPLHTEIVRFDRQGGIEEFRFVQREIPKG